MPIFFHSAGPEAVRAGYSQGGDSLRPCSGVAKNSENWNGRQNGSSTLLDEEDEAFLRPAVPSMPGRKAARPRAAAQEPELVPNYDAAEDGFLRARRRVQPKKTPWQRLLGTRLGRVLIILAALVVLGCLGMLGWAVQDFLRHDAHFRIDTSADIEASGTTELPRGELDRVFGSDIGRNVFFVPLRTREAALEGEPWVKHATVMRLLPHTLRVTVVERVPVAFVRVGRQIGLVDSQGVLLPMAPATLAARHYSFPVVIGLDPQAPAQARADRMKLYGSFVAALGTGVASQLSEVDVSDLHDVRAVVPAQGSDLLLHFGDSDFLERWHSYGEHLPEWRQQYPNLSAVDLRYDRQVVLKMADAAQADEAVEAASSTPAKQPASPAHSGANHPRPAHAVPAESRPAPRQAASVHGSGRAWFTERRGPHGAVKWVPHYIAKAGKGAAR